MRTLPLEEFMHFGKMRRGARLIGTVIMVSGADKYRNIRKIRFKKRSCFGKFIGIGIIGNIARNENSRRLCRRHESKRLASVFVVVEIPAADMNITGDKIGLFRRLFG